MRLFIVLSGAALIAIAVAYLILIQAVAVFTFPVGAIVIILGVMISPPTRVTSQKGQGSASLVVDRAHLGFTIYELLFFDTRLVLKRLATANTTFFSIIVLAIAGFAVGDKLIGALAGVAAGYALQEFTAQNRRPRSPVNDSGFKLGNGDIEISYAELDKVRVEKNRLVLHSKRGFTKIGLPRGYGAEVSSKLRPIFQGKFKDE